jgi:DNA-binding PadR family transcriptional regulator
VAAVPEPISLTPVSYLVLGLVGEMQACTPYEMKQFVSRSVGYFWTFPHSQLYAEPSRLAAAGLLDEEVEPTGRRRKTYRLTRQGRAALARWLAEPSSDPTEIRDLGLLKLFFGGQTGSAERRALAAEQHRSHDERRVEYEQLREEVGEIANTHQLATLEMGLRYERAMTAFWKELLRDDGG